MNGRIGVDSVLGEGSHFWIELPQGALDSSAKQADTLGDGEGAVENMKQRRHTVLYVDDNPVNLKLVSQILSKQQHINLLTSEDPENGLALATTESPELILLDINMPHLNGYQVMAIMQQDEKLKQIPVIAMTANAMPEEIERGKAAGFSDYLTKPLNIKKLIKAVDIQLQS